MVSELHESLQTKSMSVFLAGERVQVLSWEASPCWSVVQSMARAMGSPQCSVTEVSPDLQDGLAQLKPRL